jgi:hypothetical protein
MRRAARAGRRLVLGCVVVGLVAACGSTQPTATPASPTTGPTDAPAATATPTPASSGAASPAVSGGAVEDPSLLAILPATVDGVDVTIEHEAFQDAVSSDPGFAQNVRRAAFGVAVSGTDLVSGVVAELVPDTFSDAFFRDWRDTYDAGACSQAGGVTGNAETQIGDRTVYIGTCAGGLRTYHAWLPERGAIVSAFSLGDKRLGEALMEGLRP